MGAIEELASKVFYYTGIGLFFLAFTCYFLGQVLNADYLIPGAGFANKVKYIVIISVIIYVVLTYIVKSNLLQVVSATGLVFIVLLWISIVIKMLICRLPIVSHLTPKNFGQASAYVVISYVLTYLAKMLDSSNDITSTIEYLKSILVYKW